MAINYQLQENNEHKLKEKLKTESINYFDTCPKCSMCQNNIKDWMKHLVDRHPLPIEWMSNAANYLTDEKIMKPYTTVTESRKKRKKSITPRPLNSFMIFSRHLRRNTLIFFNDASNSEISKLLGKLWNNISSPIKSMYDTEAKKLALLHSKEFPEYKYQPKKKKKLYSSKRNTDSCTPLSSYSLDNASDNALFPTSEVGRRCSSFEKDGNPQSAVSCRDFQESKFNSFINHNSKSGNFTKLDIPKGTKKNGKTPHKISITNHMVDDSEGAESSPSSFKNTMKSEIVSTYSPFNNEFNGGLSDSHFDGLIKQENDRIALYSPNGDMTFFNNSNPTTKFSVNKYSHIMHKNTGSATKLTTPLTIVTDKEDDPHSFSSTTTNLCLVKIVNENPFENCTGIDMTQSDKIATPPPQRNLNFKDTTKLFLESDESVFDLNPNSEVVRKQLQITDHHLSRYNDHFIQDMGRRCGNLDPLIFEDMFENDNYEEDPPHFHNTNNNSSSWPFKSPNFKPSAGSSNVSDKDTYEAPSPFHLSENEIHATPIQRLPAIGSWLRSTYSEFMI